MSDKSIGPVRTLSSPPPEHKILPAPSSSKRLSAKTLKLFRALSQQHGISIQILKKTLLQAVEQTATPEGVAKVKAVLFSMEEGDEMKASKEAKAS